jgi:hypothetical protein
MKMEAIRSSETSVPTRSTLCHTPEDGILLLDLINEYGIYTTRKNYEDWSHTLRFSTKEGRFGVVRFWIRGLRISK